VNELWLDDLEALEAITQDDYTRRMFLRLAQLSQDGRVRPFLLELRADRDLDAETKATVSEVTRKWAILDSNQGPPPYQSGALTN
jgi:hypothetical protein